MPGASFEEIHYTITGDIAYLSFEFYNGAMTTENCKDLLRVFKHLKEQVRLIILMGSEDFFSNGINLNTIEAADSTYQETIRNLTAMNDLVYEILTADILTLSVVRGNCAAGGVMLAIASDAVAARTGVVFNPHYKTMGLSGSEYWTYSLPRKVGSAKANQLIDDCLPIGTKEAIGCGLIEHEFTSFSEVEEIAAHMLKDFERRIQEKKKRLAQVEDQKPLQRYNQDELFNMSKYAFSKEYKEARQNFVRKIKPAKMPSHLLKTS
jgi:putative two-component system hydrogenase maturation factor HypX/HoxX